MLLDTISFWVKFVVKRSVLPAAVILNSLVKLLYPSNWVLQNTSPMFMKQQSPTHWCYGWRLVNVQIGFKKEIQHYKSMDSKFYSSSNFYSKQETQNVSQSSCHMWGNINKNKL